MLRIPDRHPILWGYMVEAVLSALIWFLVQQICGPQAIARFLYARKADLFFTVGLAAATCGLFFGAFVAFMCTDFGRRIRRAGAAVEYLAGFLSPFLAFAVTTACLHFVSSPLPGKSHALALLLLIYCAINCITMPRNLIGVTRLWQDVEKREG